MYKFPVLLEVLEELERAWSENVLKIEKKSTKEGREVLEVFAKE